MNTMIKTVFQGALAVIMLAAGACLRADISNQRVAYRDPLRPFAVVYSLDASGSIVITPTPLLLYKPILFTGSTTNGLDPAAWTSNYVDMTTYSSTNGVPAGIPSDPTVAYIGGTTQVVVNGTTFTTNYSSLVIGGTTYYMTGTRAPEGRFFSFPFPGGNPVPVANFKATPNIVTSSTTLWGVTPTSGTAVSSGTSVPIITYAPNTVLVLGYKTTDGSYVVPDTTNDGPGAASRVKPYVGNGATPLTLKFAYSGTGNYTQRIGTINYYDNYALLLQGTENGRYTLDLTDLGMFRWHGNDENLQGAGIAGPSDPPDIQVRVGAYATYKLSINVYDTSGRYGDSQQVDGYWGNAWQRVTLEAPTSVLDCSAALTDVILNYVSGVPGSLITSGTSTHQLIIGNNLGGAGSTGSVTSYVASYITGNGGLHKQGTGNLYFTGTCDITQGVYADNGALYNNGYIKGQVTVGRYLGGIGTIEGNVTMNSNTYLAPGPSGGVPGTLTIKGDVTLTNDNDWILMNIASPTSYSQLIVNGNVSVRGSIFLQVTPGCLLDAGVYQLIISQHPIIGMDQTKVIMPSSLTIQGKLPTSNRNPNILEVYLFQNQFSPIQGLSPNGAQGAALVDKLLVPTKVPYGGDGLVDSWAPKPEAASLVSTLNSITGLRTMDRALGQVIPTAHRYWFANEIAVSTDLIRRMEERSSQPLEGTERDWALFAAASFLNTTMPSLDGAESIAANTSRFIGGVDYYATPDLTVSAYLSKDDTDAKVDPLGGTGTIKGNTIGLYMDYRLGKTRKWRIDATALYGRNDYKSNRSVMLAGLGDYAKGSTTGECFGGSLNISRAVDIPSAGITLRPYAGAQYIKWDAKPFNETDATFPLHVDMQNANSLVGKAGLSFNSSFKVWKKPVRFFATGGYQYEFQKISRDITGKFAGELYKVTYSEGKRLGYIIRAGFEADVLPRVTFTASLGRENGLHNFDNVSYYGGLSYHF